jgi:hypothetical protein
VNLTESHAAACDQLLHPPTSFVLLCHRCFSLLLFFCFTLVIGTSPLCFGSRLLWARQITVVTPLLVNIVGSPTTHNIPTDWLRFAPWHSGWKQGRNRAEVVTEVQTRCVKLLRCSCAFTRTHYSVPCARTVIYLAASFDVRFDMCSFLCTLLRQ